MGAKRLNKNGHCVGILQHIQVLEMMCLWRKVCAGTTKHNVCHGNKVDYSLRGFRSMAKYRIEFILVGGRDRQMTTHASNNCLLCLVAAVLITHTHFTLRRKAHQQHTHHILWTIQICCCVFFPVDCFLSETIPILQRAQWGLETKLFCILLGVMVVLANLNLT